MNPPWWGIPVIVVIGALVIVAGWWWDRRRNRANAAGYVTEPDLQSAPLPPTMPDADLTALLATRGPEPTLPGGIADAEFLTHPRRGVAAVETPWVFVTDAEVDDDRLLLPLLTLAQQRDLPLVLLAPSISLDSLGTLRANLRTGRATVLPVEVADPDLLAKAASLVGTAVTPASDLQADWLPETSFGRAAAWIADLDNSWIIAEPSASPGA